MDKYKKAILRYEEARQRVIKLDSERRALVSNCENIRQVENQNENINSHNLNNFKEAKFCLAVAWDNMRKWNKGEWGEDLISYDEALDSDSLDTFNGVVCNSCRSAFRLKTGKLAEAKREFGAAKISIAKLGQGIIGG